MSKKHTRNRNRKPRLPRINPDTGEDGKGVVWRELIEKPRTHDVQWLSKGGFTATLVVEFSKRDRDEITITIARHTDDPNIVEVHHHEERDVHCAVDTWVSFQHAMLDARDRLLDLVESNGIPNPELRDMREEAGVDVTDHDAVNDGFRELREETESSIDREWGKRDRDNQESASLVIFEVKDKEGNHVGVDCLAMSHEKAASLKGDRS